MTSCHAEQNAYLYCMELIRNKVQESGILTIDLAQFKTRLGIREVDIANQLWQGLVLKEKDYRVWIKDHDWSAYKDSAVFVHCSADAVIPTWAYMLVASQLIQQEVPFLIGEKSELERKLILDRIDELELEPYQDARIMIKGCSDIADPAFAMSELMKRLQPIAKSIMYGEPCSSVPVFKRK